jgi:nitric oxide reductase subunit B
MVSWSTARFFGHGAYLGPDFTADYLQRAALTANKLHGSSSQTPQESTIADFKANRYDATSGVLNYSAAQTEAFNQLLLHDGDTRDGLRPSAITDPH